VEDLGLNRSFWRGRRVFVSGHTGFKGSWLTLWLDGLGAHVFGYALPPPTTPSLFETARVMGKLQSHALGDLADRAALTEAIERAEPEIVFHMAAQALVRQGYADPVETYMSNVVGTIHLLEAVRGCPSISAIINVTTDKCYENRESTQGYREDDALGGSDPYSSSKACSELVTAAYRHSFLEAAGVAVATARAGNVIGGGDWAADRLLPDALRALDAGLPLEIRAPAAIRPWQHVLEPLSGYLLLAERLCREGTAWSGAWNFGPSDENGRTVAQLLDDLARLAPDFRWQVGPSAALPETTTLLLDSGKARRLLGWRPRWAIEEALEHTLAWHLAWKQGRDMTDFTLSQIQSHADGFHASGADHGRV
jgi:CDP-glucose 4,6-dehydratase